jgi:hypothetical protein
MRTVDNRKFRQSSPAGNTEKFYAACIRWFRSVPGKALASALDNVNDRLLTRVVRV